MANTIYFIKSETRNGTYFKVGFTKNWAMRVLPYITHNPAVQFIEYVNVYNKTKRNLEVEIHAEIEKMGYQFKETKGIKTEWFFVPKNKEKEFEQIGLNNFKACKGRTIIKF
jgi:hypothetical protein